MDANGGITGNLSNHEGELDAVDQAIKDCLIDKEQLENEKELKRDLAKELNMKEGDIIQGQLSKEAKERRRSNTLKYKASNTTSSSSSTPSSLGNDSSEHSSAVKSRAPRVTNEERFFGFLMDSQLLQQQQQQQLPAAKKQKVDSLNNRDVEKDLMRKFSVLDESNTWTTLTQEAGLSSASVEVLEAITLKVLVNIYCCNGVGSEPNPQMFKTEMESFGMSKLDAIKLNVYIRDTSEKTFEEWLEEHQDLIPQPSLLDHFPFP
jgi:hypothetical protein